MSFRVNAAVSAHRAADLKLEDEGQHTVYVLGLGVFRERFCCCGVGFFWKQWI